MSPEFDPTLFGIRTALGTTAIAGLYAANSSLFELSKPRASAVYGAVTAITQFASGSAITSVAQKAFPNQPVTAATAVLAAGIPNAYLCHKLAQKVAEHYCDVKVAGKEALKLGAFTAAEAMAITSHVIVGAVSDLFLTFTLNEKC